MDTPNRPVQPLLRIARYITPEELIEAIASLKGILLGIGLDREVNDTEVDSLLAWTRTHYHLIERNPFWEIKQAIRVCTVDEENRPSILRDLLWLCERYEMNSPFYNQVSTDLLTLRGICQGILADGKLNHLELQALNQWLDAHQHLHRHYPYDEIRSIISQLIISKPIGPSSQERLMRYFADFAAPHTQQAAVHLPLNELFTHDPVVRVAQCRFALAGFQSISKLAQIKNSLLQLHAAYHDEPSPDTCYLVVSETTGAQWQLETGGRKIETALRLRRGGFPISIIREADLWKALQRKPPVPVALDFGLE